ncbi:MAG: threonine aldolase family protein [Alphaproteobacteria bacterium]
MNFCSDNVTPAARAVLEAVVEANMGPSMPYGNDPLTASAADAIRAAFDLEPGAGAVHLLGTGTAANGLALAQVTPPYGAVICHAGSHVNTSECGGPELHSGGAKLLGLPGRGGKLVPEEVTALIDRHADGDPHHSPPRALSLTNATETGQVYTPDEVRALAAAAHAGGLAVHLDGARFANAVASLGCAPADISWRAGVDIMSLGGTKNGCIAAEAVVIFAPDRARDFEFRIKRAGHVWSKSRFIAAQYLGYLRDGNWLAYAGHANAMAARLAQGLAGVAGCRLLFPVEANQLFLTLPAAARAGLRAAGYDFYDMPAKGADTIRLVTAHDTRAEDVDGFVATARRAAEDATSDAA